LTGPPAPAGEGSGGGGSPPPPCPCTPQPTHSGQGQLWGWFALVDSSGFFWYSSDAFSPSSQHTVHVPWHEGGETYRLIHAAVHDQDFCADGQVVYSNGGIADWDAPGGVPAAWSPTLGTGPALPFWHWMWWIEFTVPPGDGTGVRQVTAGGRSTNATGERHPCDVDDEPRELSVTVNLCDFAPLDPQPTPADGGGDLTVEPVPAGWPDHFEWHLLDCGGGTVYGPITTTGPTLTEDDLPPHTPQAQPVWHSGRVRVTGVREANGGDTPHEIRVSAAVDVFDPCTQRPRCGNWQLTTYYTPREDRLPTDQGSDFMPLRPASLGVVEVRAGFRQLVITEGWGRLAQPVNGHSYIGDPVDSTVPPDGVIDSFDLADFPQDSDGDQLIAFESLATDPTYIPEGKKAGFYMIPINEWPGGSACGYAVDTGGSIQGEHIDFYVGELGPPGTGPGSYENRGTRGPASRQP
ncbi:MAG: hypothetical protein HUU25_14130, partial [Candidatus Sumerlaeia bacterium]|nr:hypothetical protein [Candidatus Sumerlaeia bacterium]